LGRRKVPQFVMPRTTPPAVRTWLPAVRAILEGVLGVCEGGVVCVEGVLFDLVDAAAGTDLRNVLVEQDMLNSALRLTTPINSYNMADVDCWCLRAGYVTALP
jgi:hypothetical protein